MRSCLFCLNQADSKEHVWPGWLLDFLGQGQSATVQWEQPGRSILSWSGIRAGIIVRCVCDKCNTGWMSDLEELAKPVISPLLLGEHRSIDTEQQLTIAVWAVKTAMTLEATSRRVRPFYRIQDRSRVAKASLPPSNTTVWLSAYDGQHHSYAYATKMQGRADNGAPVKSYVTTMSFARFVIQVATIRARGIPEGTIVTADVKPGVWDQGALIRIWPDPGDIVNWPPPLILTDDLGRDLETFSDRFGV